MISKGFQHIYDMESKKCSTCKKSKPLDEFSKKKSRADGRQSNCKSCHKEYRKQHYIKNKQKYISKAAKWRLNQKQILLEYLSNKCCKDCGNKDVRVLEFDHIEDNKEFCIGQKVGQVSIERLKKEIDKCEVVCANCHRIRTINRGNHYRINKRV